LHDLRLGAASWRLAAGVDIAAVSKMLGHSSISITADTYSHLLPGVGRQAAEAAMALVPRAQPGESVPTTCPQPENQAAEDVDETTFEDKTPGQEGALGETRTHNPRIVSKQVGWGRSG
jgi:hypothetical protein